MGPGDVVALLAPNGPDFAIAFHAVALTGAAVTPINPAYGVDEIAFQLRDSAAAFVIAHPTSARMVQDASAETGTEMLAVIGESSWDELVGDPIDQVRIDTATSVVALPYSSGTTGLPKGVMLTHRNLVVNLMQGNAMWGYSGDDVALAVLPFFHIYGLNPIMNGLLAAGVPIVSLPRSRIPKLASVTATV